MSDRNAARDRPVVVVGLMGSGKTTVAERLARTLDRPLRDSDPDLRALYGTSAAEQVAGDGVEVLHAREARHLREALTDNPAPVIAAAASVVEDPACRDHLAEAFVVWLDAPTPVLAERMREGRHRPHYDPDLTKMLAHQRERRERWFRAVADVVVDVTDIPPDQVAERVLAAFAAH